jgi:tRNA(Ile)-lysidine synthase
LSRSAPSSTHRLTTRVLSTIERHQLILRGESVLAAVSGGADSVALLDVLRELRPTLGFTLACVHVHHGLRAEAEDDAQFVRRLCERFELSFHLERVTVRRQPPWEGLEAEARRARYAALEARALAVGARRIATGHNADDQAETVLMRLVQGTGPRGLAGIAAARGVFIRPLLDVRREDIVAHLLSRELDWVEDATNRDSRFLRNRIRHDVLPFLARALGPGVVESLCRSAALTRRVITDLERQARSELEGAAARGMSGVVLPVATLQRLPEELAVQVLLLAATDLGDARPRRGAVLRALRAVPLNHVNGRRVALGRLCVERSGPWLRVGPKTLPSLEAQRLAVPGSIALTEIGMRIDARVLDRTPDYVVPRDARRVAFDADYVPPTFGVRARRPGDRFAPFGGPGERRLKSFLIDAGIPRWERSRTPLLHVDGEIVWVVGLRRGQRAPVGPRTNRILEVTLHSL